MYRLYILFVAIAFAACSKNDSKPSPSSFNFESHSVNGESDPSFKYTSVGLQPVITFTFNDKIKQTTVANAVTFTEVINGNIPFNTSFQDEDKTVVIIPASPLKGLTQYHVVVSSALTSEAGIALGTPVNVSLLTQLDSTDKFETISDDDLLTLVQKQTFKYFWDFGHPTSGLARERNTSGDVVTTGGSGFGIMAIVAGINRDFITRS